MIPFAASNPLGAVLGPLEDFIRETLTWIHDSSGLPWAWCIIVLTIMVRICLLPLTVKQTRSMQGMARLQPQIKALQAKYKHDRQKLNQEMMAFYKENKVNPFGSCLPLVLQLPVFFALFFVLQDFADNPPGGDLSFLGSFVPDITEKTSEAGFAGVVLIVVYVASQVLSTLLMPSTMPKEQRYIFLALPFVFVLFVVNFPIGLMLYWITTNLWTVGQQATIRRLMPMPKPEPVTAKSSGTKRSSRSEPKAGGDAKAGAAKAGGAAKAKGGGGQPKGDDGSNGAQADAPEQPTAPEQPKTGGQPKGGQPKNAGRGTPPAQRRRSSKGRKTPGQ